MLHIDGTGAVPLMLKFKLLTEISGGAPDNKILLGKWSEAFWWWETDDSSDFRGIIVAQRSGIIKAGLLEGKEIPTMIINISYNTFWFISTQLDLSYNNECNRYQWLLLLT